MEFSPRQFEALDNMAQLADRNYRGCFTALTVRAAGEPEGLTFPAEIRRFS
jgi:hypothetical protein